MPGGLKRQHSRTYSTQRQRVLSPGQISNIAAGKALHLDGVRWQLLTLTPDARAVRGHRSCLLIGRTSGDTARAC